MRSPEGHEKDATRKFLKTIPHCWFFNPYMAGFGASGVPDIVGCVAGHLFSVEVKREGKEPTPIQWKRMREIEAAGGKCFWGVAEKIIGEMHQWLATLENQNNNSLNRALQNPASAVEQIQLSRTRAFLPGDFDADVHVSPAEIAGRRSK